MRARDCKIVATMGPASDAPERLAMLIQAGVDCFRLNFSHGAREDHARRMQAIRAAEAHAGTPVGVFADFQGPKIRVGMFAKAARSSSSFNDIVTVEASSRTRRTTASSVCRTPNSSTRSKSATSSSSMTASCSSLSPSAAGAQRKARVDFGGTLKNQKGVNVPTRRIPISALTEKDREDLAYALDLGVDYIALSFVQHPEDVREARALIGDRAGIIAKIEKPSALTEIEAIVEAADAVMVARGDLGVELPPEQVPIAQRKIIRSCPRRRQAGDRRHAHARKYGRSRNANARRSLRCRHRRLSRR
jgi:pyruvate kinase